MKLIEILIHLLLVEKYLFTMIKEKDRKIIKIMYNREVREMVL